MSTYLFTSESVSEGHPDKVADQISDAILDEYLRRDPDSRVAVETMVTSDNVILAGEVHSSADISCSEIENIVRDVVQNIGYTYGDLNFHADTLKITNYVHEQSPAIHDAVDKENELGAGDQGMMFGFACRELETELDEIPAFMPMPLMYAHGLVKKLAEIRKNKNESIMPYLRPDSKSQVTVEYDSTGRIPKRIDTIVIATQHDDIVGEYEIRKDMPRHIKKDILKKVQNYIKKDIKTHLLPHVIDEHMMDDEIKLIVNSSGEFIEGGPHADAGLTGRKIIVDTYGGRGAHGGGAFSGKDPSKVDRSAAYAARYIAKNLVAADLADMIEIQIAYTIGKASPVSLFIDSSGTAKRGLDDHQLEKIVKNVFDCLKPEATIKCLGLRDPIYQKTAAYGHFGWGKYPWEKLDAVEKLKDAAKIYSNRS